MVKGGRDKWKDGRMDGHLKIPPCALQDIFLWGRCPKSMSKTMNILVNSLSILSNDKYSFNNDAASLITKSSILFEK